jgi:hypothetical protein
MWEIMSLASQPLGSPNGNSEGPSSRRLQRRSLPLFIRLPFGPSGKIRWSGYGTEQIPFVPPGPLRVNVRRRLSCRRAIAQMDTVEGQHMLSRLMGVSLYGKGPHLSLVVPHLSLLSISPFQIFLR